MVISPVIVHLRCISSLWEWQATQFLPVSVCKRRHKQGGNGLATEGQLGGSSPGSAQAPDAESQLSTDTVVQPPGAHSEGCPTGQNYPERPAPSTPGPQHHCRRKSPRFRNKGEQQMPHFSPPSLFWSLPVSPHCLFSPSRSGWIQHLNQREVGVNHQSFRQAQMPTGPTETDPHSPSEAQVVTEVRCACSGDAGASRLIGRSSDVTERGPALRKHSFLGITGSVWAVCGSLSSSRGGLKGHLQDLRKHPAFTHHVWI